jgi:hypothetical protein
LIKTFSWYITNQFPCMSYIRIKWLKFNNAFIRSLFEFWFLIKTFFRFLKKNFLCQINQQVKQIYFIKRKKITNGWWFRFVFRKIIFEISDKHTKLCTPIPKMIQSENIKTNVFKKTSNTITNDCWSITEKKGLKKWLTRIDLP